MRNEFLLWNNASRGLPRQGLVALYDPYRDAYGRNVLASGLNTIAGMPMVALTANGTNGVLETGATSDHRVEVAQISDALTCVIAFKAKANGRNIIRVWRSNWGDHVNVDLSAGTAGGTAGRLLSIEQDEDGVCSVVLTFPAYTFGNGIRQIIVSLYDGESLASIGNLTYAGDTSKGIELWDCQLNLGPTLYPYSAPAGAPGTLQTSLDYSGHGNNLTLGATTNASTDDPSNTGTAWSFDEGDFLTVGDTAKCVIAGPFTLTVVAQWDTSVFKYPRLIGKEDCYGIYIKETTQTFRFFGNIGGTQIDVFFGSEATPQIPPVTPCVLSITYSGAILEGYVNGVRLGGSNYSGAVRTDVLRDMMLGNRPAGDRGLNGEIYWAGVWEAYMPQSQQAKVYRYLKSLMASRGVTLA